jgi:hypothetical protein
MKRLFFLLFALGIPLTTLADIAPNPIQAKGISVRAPTEIKMTYEKVTITLTPDSSFVHCYFKLHNEGKAEKVQVGYPYMNTTPYTSPDSKFAPIKVWQDGVEINEINTYVSNLTDMFSVKNSWYLWDTFLGEDRTMEIEVEYSLPYGVVKNNLYYKFNYLLSTGAGWKGRIDTAEIVVTLKDLDKRLILTTTPQPITTTGNQLTWKFSYFEPTEKDDILICYEKKPGEYNEKLKGMPVFLKNEETFSTYDIRTPNNPASIDPNDIYFIYLIKSREEVEKWLPDTITAGGIILVYTKDFIPYKLVNTLNTKLNGTTNLKIENYPLPEFFKKYSFKIDGEMIKNGYNNSTIFIKIHEKNISQISLKKIKLNKYLISINTN